MIIKKYIEFIKESEISNFNSLGEWVVSLIDDIYIKNIVNRYIKDVPSDIDMDNAINTLDDRTKTEIRDQIEEYLINGIEEKDPNIIASTETELLESLEIGSQIQTETPVELPVAGRRIFESFLTSLTNLGLKENKPNWELCPEDFLLFYYFPNLNSEIVKKIFNRYRSLTRYLDIIDYGQNELNLYFGLTIDGKCEYGIQYDMRFPIGKFDLPKNVIKWMLSLESKSAQSLKKEIVNLSHKDMMVLGQIKTDMKTFTPGYFEKKMTPMLRDKVISFGYYGVGKWDNGVLDEGEYLNLKQNFTNWLLSKKWGSKVLISVKPESFWLYIHIKLK